MNRTLLIAALALCALLPTAIAKSPASANDTVAQAAAQGSSSMKSTMDSLRDQISSMTPSGNTDADYKASMKMLGTAVKGVLKAEMHNSKNPQMVETAEQVYHRLFESNPNPFYIGG
jgi:hypothetical protein